MTDSFNVGDVVVCVDGVGDDHPNACLGSDAVCVGDTVRVSNVFFDSLYPEDPWALCFVGKPNSWPASYFRKLPRADEEFARQMRACKPKRVPELADISQRNG